ncbi:hypothetical protein K443DRAFT_110824, partial [Laccaria amethystina LaAM-08-1]
MVLGDSPSTSSSDSSINLATLSVPMPTPGTANAPLFKGKRVNDFLDSLEQHADSAKIPHNHLPSYVLRYCHTKVCKVISGSAHFSADDWVGARSYLLDLYGSNDAVPANSPDRLRQWCLKHGETGFITSRKEVDKYYREFTALSSNLTPTRMLANDVSLCFYRGIPTSLRTKIKKRIPVANLKTSAPPEVATLLNLLRAEFDEDDLDAKVDSSNLDLDSDSDSDSSSSDSEDDIDKVTITKKKKKPTKKKKTTFEKTVPAAPIAEPVGISPVDKITKQMEDLKLAHTEFLRSMNITTNNNPSASQIMRELRCFFCDSVNHRLGLHNCPEVKACINEGLVAYTPQGRLARSDGSDLPRAFGSDGGVAKILRDQRGTSSQMKEDVLSNEVYNASTTSLVPAWRAPPLSTLAVTRSQKEKEVRFDPIKRPDGKENEAKQPVQSTPQAFNLRQPASTPKPPQVNTEDAFKNRRVAPLKAKQDVEMKDEPVKAKSTPQYHFTSDIQEMYDLDKIVRDKVNKTTVQLELGELLALSAFLQKSVSNMTKTRREYNTKPVTASIVEILEDEDDYASELVGGYDDELSYPSSESAYTNTGYVESRIGLEFDEATEDKEEIM